MLKSCFQYGVLEAGCDEAGRGCLAGPVFAAAVVLPSDYRHDELNDSKQLSAGKRERLRLDIERDALAWAVARVDAPEIDRINILQASIRAMNLAVEGLSLRPELLLIDGNRFHTASGIPFRCVVKGDATYLSIAAASV
ncbi:MAG: ribonuclease HII, partial [Bacteroidales bacterium]|nr:ribonuclease HII [Bacteroidales bacterium]